jgi:hypothetical protein
LPRFNYYDDDLNFLPRNCDIFNLGYVDIIASKDIDEHIFFEVDNEEDALMLLLSGNYINYSDINKANEVLSNHDDAYHYSLPNAFDHLLPTNVKSLYNREIPWSE